MKKVIILLGVVVLIALGFYLFKNFKVEKPKPSKPSLTKEYPFRVSSAANVYPRFLDGIFSKRPKEVKGGEKLQAKIKIEDPSGLKEVKFKVVAEPNFEKEVLMSYDKQSNYWQAEIFLPQEVKEIVWTNFLVKNNENKEDKLELSWSARNTCPIKVGDLEITSSCDITVGEDYPFELVAGTQTGRITFKPLSSSSITINLSGAPNKPAYLVFGDPNLGSGGVDLSGNKAHIVLPGHFNDNPTILIRAGKPDSVRRAPARICVRDKDNDTYLGNHEIAGRYPERETGRCPTDYKEATPENYRPGTIIKPGDCDDEKNEVYPGRCCLPPNSLLQKCDDQSFSGNCLTTEPDCNCIVWNQKDNMPSPRSNYASVVFNDKIWILGGDKRQPREATPFPLNDVWSSADGIHWNQVIEQAAWQPRFNHTAVVFDNRIWIIGGRNENDLIRDPNQFIMYSADGIYWESPPILPNLPSPPYLPSPREGHTAVVFNDAIYIIGGNDWGSQPLKDVWRVKKEDENEYRFEMLTNSAPWAETAPRAGHASVVFNDKIWLLGGSCGYLLDCNDVWSSADGIHWTREIEHAPWNPRYGHSALVFDNKILIMGGFSFPHYYNDVWSSENGITWTQITDNASWPKRIGHGSVVFNNKIWLMLGRSDDLGKLYGDIWSCPYCPQSQ